VSQENRDDELMKLIAVTVADDFAAARRILTTSPSLAGAMLVKRGATRQSAVPYYFDAIDHYVYAGDTALHIAAAAYSLPITRLLVKLEANASAANRRGAQPLHYAADGVPGSAHWNPRAQADVIRCLVKAGADPDARDKSGVSPLHRAIRMRCSSAVEALLECGADVSLRNGSGSTVWDLATKSTGRGGSGSAEAREEQARIVRLLEAARR
jgi:hypothetical protein